MEGLVPFNEATRSITCDVCDQPIGSEGRYMLHDGGDGENGPCLEITWAGCRDHAVQVARAYTGERGYPAAWIVEEGEV